MTQKTMRVLRWCVSTDDRIGMVRDIVAEIAAEQGNVEAMEVVVKSVYVRFGLDRRRISSLRTRLETVQGVHGIQDVDRLPFEADEEALVRRVMRQDAHTVLSFETLTYASEAMGKVVQIASTVAKSDASVLITGESGTGKELLARAIHNVSRRRDRRFVPINCAAIPDALLESELFGYVEGAFTGAVRGGKPGLFEIANGGTLLLDEIGEMNPLLQAKVLRVLADGELRKVGSTSSVKVDVRIIAATNRDVPSLVEKGMFREDLYYRLNVIPLHIPPLRERREDIAPLVHRFLSRLSRELEREFRVSDEAWNCLLAYDYPGNVRELQNIVERACYLNEGNLMRPVHFLLPVRNPTTGCQPTSSTLKERVRDYEICLIEEALRKAGSLRKAAQILGTTHTALVNKLKHKTGKAKESHDET